MLFVDIYADEGGAIDPTAEYIRTLEVYAPCCLSRMIELSVVKEQPKVPTAMLMVKELYEGGEKILDLLKKANKEALADEEDGIANFLADRMSAHGKWCWQLNSLMK